MAPNGSASRRPEESCCGVVQEAREKSAARREKPQPWLVRKLTIFITLGIIGYAFYVYIARLCLPMIRQDARALGGRAMGIVFLVVFCVLGLMMLWAYEKVVLTSPGYAKYYVQKSPAPLIENALPTWWDTESEANLAVARYQGINPRPERANGEFEPRPNGDVHRSTNSRRTIPQNGPAEPEEQNAGITDALPPVAAVRAKATAEKGPVLRPERSEQKRRPSATRQTGLQPQPLPGSVGEPKPKMFTRSPPTTPILLPQYRYCHKDGFLKPFRAHHCRACGTCVLKYDHHCPWIGQCVGARNHRFFMIFVFWALWFCAWTFSTLVGVNAHASAVRSIYDIDGQQVAMMAFSGLFILFTSALYGSHIQLICDGQSTVESLNAHRMREREERVLARLHSWWDFRGKRRTRKQWDAEWGRVGKEGHPWWLGSARANWAATMGASAWMWFLPIGKSPDDGLNYTLNPRFDREGRWLPRREWPEELR